MATIQGFPSLKIIRGFHGVLDFYMNQGNCCVRTWPRSPGHRRAAAVEAQWPAFTVAAKLWNDLSPQVRAAFNSMAQNGGLSGHDLAMRAYLSGLFTYPTGGIG